MTNRLLHRWGKVWRWLLCRPTLLALVRIDELPDELDANSLYVVGEGGYSWYAAMLCPCGCGATLHMNLLPDSRPRWWLSEHWDGAATLHPSVWRTKDCRSHFFVRRGLIQWCLTQTSRNQSP